MITTIGSPLKFNFKLPPKPTPPSDDELKTIQDRIALAEAKHDLLYPTQYYNRTPYLSSAERIKEQIAKLDAEFKGRAKRALDSKYTDEYRASYKRQYYLNNRERILEVNRKYKANNPDRSYAAQNRWKLKNRDRVLANHRAYNKRRRQIKDSQLIELIEETEEDIEAMKALYKLAKQ